MTAFLIVPIVSLVITIIVHVIMRRVILAASMSFLLALIVGTFLTLELYGYSPDWPTVRQSLKWGAISGLFAVAIVSPIALLLRWLLRRLRGKEKRATDSPGPVHD